ncbi:MAG: (2Fe-2S)-binding protein, partial [Planctomycetota bacterium]
MIRFTLNGRDVEVEPRSGESLLETLRERCGVTSVKDGCRPQAQCGCCLAIVGGKAIVTCALPAEKAEGREILTLEGLSPWERTIAAKAFAAATGLQCGFCIPGIALHAKHLLDKNPAPSREEIAKAIDVNLCRCTGYTKILDAIQIMARARRGEGLPEPCTSGRVGDS